MLIKALRNNIGSIIALLGFFLLCIMTFGDLGDVLTEKYWQNVIANLTGISFISIGLTMTQISIKQGISEQALQKGLNTTNTTDKMKDHRKLISDYPERMKYLPYFLQAYNDRQTGLKKREYLVTNNYKSESLLFESKRRKAIRQYKSIRILFTPASIKWATTEIIYKKNGQIATIAEHRRKRTMNAIWKSAINMVAVTLLTKGLFFEGEGGETIGQKFIKLGTYIVAIAMTSVLSIVKEYEKGAFGVPNELEEINEIWREFHNWEVPQSVKNEVDEIDSKEVANEKGKAGSTSGADIPSEQKKGENIRENCPGNTDSVSSSGNVLILANGGK